MHKVDSTNARCPRRGSSRNSDLSIPLEQRTRVLREQSKYCDEHSLTCKGVVLLFGI